MKKWSIVGAVSLVAIVGIALFYFNGKQVEQPVDNNVSEKMVTKATSSLPQSWKLYSYDGFEIMFPEKPYVTPENPGSDARSVTYRAGQEDGTQYFLTVSDLTPEKGETMVKPDSNFLQTIAQTTKLNLVGDAGQLEGLTDTSKSTGHTSIDFKVRIPDGPRTYVARNLLDENMIYEMRVIYADHSKDGAYPDEFFGSLKIHTPINEKTTIPAVPQKTAGIAIPTSTSKLEITTTKPPKEEWGGIVIQLRSIPFNLNLTWEAWMQDPDMYDQQLTELENTQKAGQSGGLKKWEEIIASADVSSQFISYTEDQISKLNSDIAGLKSERKGKQDLLDMIPGDTFVFSGKIFEGKIVQDLKSNFSATVAVLDDTIGLLETQTSVKYGTIQAVKSKNAAKALDSANDEDTLSLVISWHWDGYQKLYKEGQAIYEKLQSETGQAQ